MAAAHVKETKTLEKLSDVSRWDQRDSPVGGRGVALRAAWGRGRKQGFPSTAPSTSCMEVWELAQCGTPPSLLAGCGCRHACR